MLESLLHKPAGLKICNSIKKRLQHSYFPVKLAKFLKTPFFREEFQWLLLTFNSRFQRSWEQKPVWLSAINTRFGSRKTAPEENCPSTPKLTLTGRLFSLGAIVWLSPNPKTNPNLESNVIPEFYYPFKAFTILNFAMTECFFFSETYLIAKKYTSSEILSFLHCWDINESVNLIQMSK